MRRFPPSRRLDRYRRRSFGQTVATLAMVTFVIVFSATDWGGTARPIESLTRDRPAVQVSAPFPNCAAARAAGATPVYRHDSGYAEHLDGDLDGIGCEPFH